MKKKTHQILAIEQPHCDSVLYRAKKIKITNRFVERSCHGTEG